MSEFCVFIPVLILGATTIICLSINSIKNNYRYVSARPKADNLGAVLHEVYQDSFPLPVDACNDHTQPSFQTLSPCCPQYIQLSTA